MDKPLTYIEMSVLNGYTTKRMIKLFGLYENSIRFAKKQLIKKNFIDDAGKPTSRGLEEYKRSANIYLELMENADGITQVATGIS